MTRPISAIARDIDRAWPKVNYAAAPYLGAMLSLNRIADSYYDDTGETVVRYFLANASTFRGDAARALKAELKAALGE